MLNHLKKIIVPFFLFFSISVFTQSQNPVSEDSERGAVIQVIKNMFDAMRDADTVKLRSTFDPEMRLIDDSP